MSEQSYGEQSQQQDPTEIASLRKAAAKGNRLERENAFLRAGIDPSSSEMLGIFYKGYDGEMNADAIKEKAAEIGLITAPPPPPAPPVDPQVEALQQAQQGVQAASTGTPASSNDGGRFIQQKAYQEGGMKAVTDVMAQLGYPVAQE